MNLRTIQKRRPERQIARMAGVSTYSTGRPCKNGHNSDRFTADGSCVGCRQRFRESYREEAKSYARDKRRGRNSEERAAYLEHAAALRRDDRARDPEKYRARERHHGRLKRQRYPKRKLADTRARQVAKQQRTPPWSDLTAIRKFYENCPIDMVVDHIVPLRGKTVSGLHVLGNLQYLTRRANLLKGNRFDDWQR